MLVLVYMTTLPLRDGIYEDIFWQIGANANVLEQHKARTLFTAALEIDFFVVFEFGLTFGFMCYELDSYQTDYGLTTEEVIINWVAFVVFSVVALLNNIHGHYIMRTVESSFNTKFYFITRFLVECVIVYVAICLLLGKNLTWEPVDVNNPNNNSKELYDRAQFYTDIILGVSIMLFILVIASAKKLIKIKRNTQSDAIRQGAGYGAMANAYTSLDTPNA